MRDPNTHSPRKRLAIVQITSTSAASLILFGLTFFLIGKPARRRLVGVRHRVRSVIGTLWPVDDEVMWRVAAAFSEEIILKAGWSMQYTNTAIAQRGAEGGRKGGAAGT